MNLRTHLSYALLLLACSAGAHAGYILSFDSTPESWVGQGESFTVTPGDGYIFSHSRNFDNGWSFRIASLNSPFGPDFNPRSRERYNYWSLDLAAPFDAPLTTGFYGNTARFPFQGVGQAGLTFSGNHRGNNRNSGFFNILDLSFDATGGLATFAVDFTQFGEGNPDWRIDGQLRYNSEYPVAVPEPHAGAALGLGLLALGYLRRRQREQPSVNPERM